MYTENEIAYLCEIAFLIWANSLQFKMDKILKSHTGIEFDYGCYPEFYKYVLDKCMERDEQKSLLEIIERTITNGIILKLFDDFLSLNK